MGFLDEIQSSMNKGMASVNRTGKSAKLKLQQSDLLKQRKELAAQLGASLYEATKNMPELVAGREGLFQGIANIDAQRAQIDAELARIDQEAQQAVQAATLYTCPTCGSTVHQGDMFCSGCGAPAEQIIAAAKAAEAEREAATQAAAAQAAPQVPTPAFCIHCGSPINAGDLFCMNCGGKQDEAPAASAATGASTEAEAPCAAAPEEASDVATVASEAQEPLAPEEAEAAEDVAEEAAEVVAEGADEEIAEVAARVTEVATEDATEEAAEDAAEE